MNDNSDTMQSLRALVAQRTEAALQAESERLEAERQRQEAFVAAAQQVIHQMLIDDFAVPYYDDVSIRLEEQLKIGYCFEVRVGNWPFSFVARAFPSPTSPNNWMVNFADRADLPIDTPEKMLSYQEDQS